MSAHPRWIIGALCLWPASNWADEAEPIAASNPIAISATVLPRTPSIIVATPTATLLAASRAQFAFVKPPETKPDAAAPVSPTQPQNEITRLPNYYVRGLRVPPPEDARTNRGLELYAMKKYLGDPDDFSRGVLNHFTIADGWKRLVKPVPILNRFEWFSSPEKTALDRYYDDEMRQKMKDLTGLLAIKP